ncbi:TrbI/VirB10 family protein [Caulobacter endophyticus]|uniref:Conjugal transfer protein TrbI n=1 Tax=Caulobacter endophyticus TaxID=2172652 RepID=A0A2T9JYT3_9CAUL|nr:TrbI/VirB10 family protein [Caulobacter endophyticus]PVM88844.1 conjugal transfer protein TrbI [Caulobacter endophyticus]
MSVEPPPADPAAASAAPKRPAEGVLVAPRRPITRYRPAVIAAVGGAIVLVVGAGFILGMGQSASRRTAPPEPAPRAPEGPTPIEDRLPSRYDDPAALPPPLGASASPEAPTGATPPPAAQSSPPVSPEIQRARQESLAARASPPFFNGAGGAIGPRPSAGATEAGAPLAPPALGSPGAAPAPPVAVSAKEQFIAAAASRGSQAPILPRPPLSPFEVKAGALISAALITGINSDLPGPVIAQVTEPVFDHRTGRTVLIPQGTRLIGRYDSQVGYGQERVLVMWTQMVFPSGRSVDLGGMVGLDAAGMSGLTGKTDRHLPVLARAIGLSTLISIGGAAAQNSAGRRDDQVVLQDAAGGVASAAGQTGQRLVERDLQRAPTLHIAPGQLVRVLIDRDLVLPPEGPPTP